MSRYSRPRPSPPAAETGRTQRTCPRRPRPRPHGPAPPLAPPPRTTPPGMPRAAPRRPAMASAGGAEPERPHPKPFLIGVSGGTASGKVRPAGTGRGGGRARCPGQPAGLGEAGGEGVGGRLRGARRGEAGRGRRVLPARLSAPHPRPAQSTVCEKIMELLGQKEVDHRQRKVLILSQDSFYKVLTAEQKAKALKGQYNFDHPGEAPRREAAARARQPLPPPLTSAVGGRGVC